MTSSRLALTIYRIFSAGVLVMFGSLVTLDIVWNIGDLFMALVTGVNLIAIACLSKYVFRLLNDYRKQKRSGIKDPVFRRSQLPEIEKDLTCWDD